MAKLAVYITDQPVPDVEIADVNALLYHIAWPQNGTVSIIAESMGSRLRSGTTNYHPPLALSSHKIIVCQDRYLVVSPKSHEQSKRMGADTPPAYELKLWTTLTPREQILRSITNKKVFLELLSKCSMGDGIEVSRERYLIFLFWCTSLRRKNPQETSTWSVFMAGSLIWRHLPPCLVQNAAWTA